MKLDSLNLEYLKNCNLYEFKQILKVLDTNQIKQILEDVDIANLDLEGLKSFVVDLDDVLLPSSPMIEGCVGEYLKDNGTEVLLRQSALVVKEENFKEIHEKIITLLLYVEKKVKKIEEKFIETSSEKKQKKYLGKLPRLANGDNDILYDRNQEIDLEHESKFRDTIEKIAKAIELAKLENLNNQNHNIVEILESIIQFLEYGKKLTQKLKKKYLKTEKDKYLKKLPNLLTEEVKDLNSIEESLIVIDEAIKLAKWLKELVFESRDCLLENDNKNKTGIINYPFMYTIENLFENTVEYLQTLKRLFNASIYSHHNGEVEYECKERLIHEIDPNILFEGQLFHGGIEHVDGQRRGRSDKALGYMEKHNYSNLIGSILIDDSLVNLRAWKAQGGIAIYFNRALKPQGENDDFLEIDSLEPNRIILILLVLGLVKEKSKTYIHKSI